MPAKLSSPLRALQVIKAGTGPATALSIFLVNALRAVGVPARIVGAFSCWVACCPPAELCAAAVLNK